MNWKTNNCRSKMITCIKIVVPVKKITNTYLPRLLFKGNVICEVSMEMMQMGQRYLFFTAIFDITVKSHL